MRKCHIKKGDNVKVIAGKGKGKSGKVLELDLRTGRAFVEGLKLVKKHLKKNQENLQGGIVEKEAPIAISNLKVSK
ncbi:MAG: 50S ribosomal protein L24 [Pontiellaceae bacterium]|nr:50S ribosomal protein L24 [Pontiellaceae bacterium]